MRKVRILSLVMMVFGQMTTSEICQGQSTFRFTNLNPPGLDAPIFDAMGNPLSGTNYVAILYGGATFDSLALATLPGDYTQPMQPVPFKELSPGYFNFVGWVGIPTVPGFNYAWLQVRAWDVRLGPTYESVVALGIGGYGESGVFQALGGDPSVTPPIPAGYLYGLQSFSLVPEPATVLILMLGLPLLLWSRRRPGGS